MPDSYLYGFRQGPGPNDVQGYLEKVDSWLARREDLVALIVASCMSNDLNCAYALALAQKEQSALWRKDPPPERAQDWLYGYACPETGGRDARFRGPEKQIRHALAQLRKYDEWDDVKNWSPSKSIPIYDPPSVRRKYGVGKAVSADTKAEAASLLYNPRVEGLALQAEFVREILETAERT